MPNSSRVENLASPRQIEVLVVQSNPADTLLTVEAFHAAGLTTGLSFVAEGEDALSYARREGKDAHVPSPDLIFPDLSQPRVSGLEVLKVIKSTPELMHIPIVVAAGSDDPKFVRAVYALNGNCFTVLRSQGQSSRATPAVTTEGRLTIHRQPVQGCVDGIGDDSTSQIGLGG
jgi:CheY-like chemotaxis protein